MIIMCGTGNNGGGGMVAARHLHNRGVHVKVGFAGTEGKLQDVPYHQWNILKKLNIPILRSLATENADLIIDCLIGYGLSGDPIPPISNWINFANESGVPILALDAPSGLDTSTGKAGNPCIRAKATMTLALPKSGLIASQAHQYSGTLYLADIGVPKELYESMGIEIGNIFAQDTIIKLRM
jgi:NAD(P)H-hydrate epimerase